MTRRLTLILGCLLATSCTRDAARSAFHAALEQHRPYRLLLAGQPALPCAAPSPATSAADGGAPLTRAADPDSGAFVTFTCAAPTGAVRARLLEFARELRAAAAGSPDSARAFAHLELLTPTADAAVLDRAVLRLERAAAAADSAAAAAALWNDLSVAYALRAVAQREPFDLFRAVEAAQRALMLDGALLAARHNRALLLGRIGIRDTAATVAAAAPGRVVAGAAARTGPGAADSARVAAWRARASAPERSTAERAQAALTDAEVAFGRGDFAGAAAGFETAARGFSELRAHPLAGWAALGRAAVALYRGDHAAVASLTSAVMADSSAHRSPSLQARARWIAGLSAARSGRYQAALTSYRAAAELYRAAGEDENLGAVQFVTAESHLLLGQDREGQRQLMAALARLGRHPESPRLHDALLYAGRYFARHQLLATARAAHQQGLRVAARTGRPKDPPEVLLRLAQTELLARDYPAARRYLDEAERGYAAVSDTLMRERGRADLLDTRSELALQEAPASAVRLLDATLAYFQAQQNHSLIIRTLTRRSIAQRTLGDLAAAARDLRHALALLEQNLAGAAGPLARSALRETGSRAYDEMIALQLALGRPDSALGYLLHARGLADGPAGGLRAVRALPAGETLIAFAALPDTIVAWAVDGDRLRVRRIPLGTAALEAQIASFGSAHLRGEIARADSVGRGLYALLLEPLLRERMPRRLRLLADGPLARLPFAALRDARTGRYLLEHTTLRTLGTAPHLAEAAAVSGPVLVASAGTFDALAFPDLPPLPAAGDEAARVAALYPGARLLAGTAVTPAALARALPHQAVLHFAGHARALPSTPERSHLVTATDERGRSLLTAADIAALDLSALQLAVLSACSSAERGAGRSFEARGLVQAFLAAGTRAVVGSVWEVEDRATAALLVRFHFHLASGMSADHALRAAQLELLRGSDPDLRRPAAWAGFQYYGG